MLADYRAKGARIRHSEDTDPFCVGCSSAPLSGQNRPADGAVKAPVKTDSEEEKPNKQNDWAPKVRDIEAIFHVWISLLTNTLLKNTKDNSLKIGLYTVQSTV